MMNKIYPLDSKYAFISVEGIGGEPGIVDVIDLDSYELDFGYGLFGDATW
jgi:hypothetical protein